MELKTIAIAGLMLTVICGCSSQIEEQAANSGQPQPQQTNNYSPNP
jgi:hypothetical protein